MGDTASTPVTVDMGVIDSIYTTAVNNNFLPDVGIIKPLQKCSFGNSDEVLQQQFRNKMSEANGADQLPAYIKDVGQALAPVTSVPNAVGMGAVVISMILDLLIASGRSNKPAEDDVYTQVRNAFIDEKSEAIYVTMDNYAKQYRHYIHNTHQLLRISTNAMDQISREVSALRRELMRGTMRSDYLKSWANGAAIHVLLMAHIANMNQTSVHQRAARIAVIDYQRELNQLLDKYKQHARSNIFIVEEHRYASHMTPTIPRCYLMSLELNTRIDLDCNVLGYKIFSLYSSGFGYGTSRFVVEYQDALNDRMFSAPNWVTALKDYFSNLKSNLDTLMTDRGVFRVPTCTELQNTYPLLSSDCY